MTEAQAAKIEREIEDLAAQIERANNSGNLTRETKLRAVRRRMIGTYLDACQLSPENRASVERRYGVAT